MSTKHSKGPWKVEHSGYSHTSFLIHAGEGVDLSTNPVKYGTNPIAEVFDKTGVMGTVDTGDVFDQGQYNAALIAAAPELLEEFKKVLQYAQDVDMTGLTKRFQLELRALFKRSELVIDKAEGRS